MENMDVTNSVKGFFQTSKRHLQVLDTTAITFTKSRATQAAASLAYYTFFSIFPLLLVFILGGSYFLDRQNVYLRVTQAVQNILPISQQFIATNLQQVLKQRTAVGIFVLVSLLWSASSVFNNLAYDINMAWPEARARNFWQTRLIGLDMIAGLTGLLILSIVLESVSNWVSRASSGNRWAVVSQLGSWIAVFLLYMAMYRWVPTVSVPWYASFWGALVASIGWKAASTGFAWYLASGFARYQLVYGSLGAIVAFLFLIYIIALITLFGAHLTAAIDHSRQERSREHPIKTAAVRAEQVGANESAVQKRT
jgi:membrane protein